MTSRILLAACLFGLCACGPKIEGEQRVRFVTVDPGHFHAALVQKSMYPGVDSVVHVYAPDGPDLKLHLNRIEGFNSRSEQPTNWQEKVYSGDDFFEKALQDKAGNVMVLAGNNQKKTEYIVQALEAGFHVLADKPMVIDSENFALLQRAFETARRQGLLLYDIMTERFEITSILQKELSQMPAIFGTLETGSPENPAVVKESVHHFFKYVSGNILTRPPWFFDVGQEGEGIVDVTTHLVDLVQWAGFPGQIIDPERDIRIGSARHWTTAMTLSQFKAVTKLDQFPDYLLKDVVQDSILRVYCNGEINYALRGIHARVSVAWAYRAPPGGGDTHYSIMRGSKANLVIKQGAEQKFKPTLYIEPLSSEQTYKDTLTAEFSKLQSRHGGLKLLISANGWQVMIPDELRVGHEAHFGQVTQRFLEYMRHGNMPEWEVPNMIAKYYTTTEALRLAKAQ